MRGVCVVVLGVVIVAVATKAEMDRNGCNEEPEKNLKKLTSFFLKPILDQLPSSIKQKRSPNIKQSDGKLLIDQRKRETLCKFCKKSELRMKTLLCKKCVANSEEVIPNLVGSPAEHSNEKSAKFTNKPEERKTENPLNKRDALAHLNSLKTNSNVRDSVFRLIKSPFVSKQTMKTFQIPPATKTTATENIKQLAQSAPLKLRNSSPTIAEFLASFPSNVKSTITEEGNTNKISRDFHPLHVHDTLLENLRTKRLKDIQHNDFLNILKETLKSQETSNNDIQKRNSNHTKQFEDSKKSSDVLNKELFNNILAKHIMEISSEEDLNLSEIIGSSKTPTVNTLETFSNENPNFSSTYNHYKSISKRTTEELTTENSLTTIQKKPENIATSIRNKIGTLYHSRFNYKKHPRERLQYRNRVWIVEKDPPTNMPFENLDEILQKMAPNYTKTTQTNDNNDTQNTTTDTSNTTEDILQAAKDLEANSTTRTEKTLAQELNTVSPTPTKEITTNKPKSALDMFKELRNQHFLNRHMYLKNPRLKSTYENGKHKFVHKKVTELNWDIFNMTTETTTASNNTAEDDGINDLLGLVKPTKNTDYEIKKISTRSVTDTPTQEEEEGEEEDELVIKIPTSKNILSRLNKLSSRGITKRVLPTKLSKLNTLKSPLATKHHDIFSKHLNMNPKINSLKYKNIALSMKNNEAKVLNPNIVSNHDKEEIFEGNPIKNNDENSSSNEIKTSQDFVSNDAAETDENKLSSAIKTLNNIHPTEYKILLPLILKQNEDGTIQLILDQSQLWANCTKNKNLEEEKNVYKRKTEDNLTKYPLNIFNILDQSSTQANNYLQIPQDDVLKEKFYKYLINEKLFKLFDTLNIPVESSAELHSYIDDLPEKERNKLLQYVLNSISNDYNAKHGNTVNQELFLKKQSEFMQSLAKIQNENKSVEKTTESNRISLQIKEDQANNLNSVSNNILKSVIREVILKELVNSNLCPVCQKQKCTCNNDNIDYPRNDYYSDEGRVIDKRHFNHVPKRENSVIVEPDNLIKKKYKIVNNFLNWARDIVVPTSRKHL